MSSKEATCLPSDFQVPHFQCTMIGADLTFIHRVDERFAHDVVFQTAHIVPVHVGPPWHVKFNGVDERVPVHLHSTLSSL